MENKTYLKWAQKKSEEDPKEAQKACRLLICRKDEHDLMNTKQWDEGKSRFGHPKRENQRAEHYVTRPLNSTQNTHFVYPHSILIARHLV